MSWNPFRDLVEERARREELDKRCESLQTTQAWLFIRVNQLEKERAILFREVTHLPIPVPEIIANPVRTSADHVGLGASPDPLSDMGDAEAKRLGIEFDDEGVPFHTR